MKQGSNWAAAQTNFPRRACWSGAPFPTLSWVHPFPFCSFQSSPVNRLQAMLPKNVSQPRLVGDKLLKLREARVDLDRLIVERRENWKMEPGVERTDEGFGGVRRG